MTPCGDSEVRVALQLLHRSWQEALSLKVSRPETWKKGEGAAANQSGKSDASRQDQTSWHSARHIDSSECKSN